jgi:hypothetical protein
MFDKDSKNEYNSESKVVIKEFNSVPAVSDIMLIAKKQLLKVVRKLFQTFPEVSLPIEIL